MERIFSDEEMSQDEMRQHATNARTNATMVQELQRNGVLHSPDCIAAFMATDRKHFWVEDEQTVFRIYFDEPLRHHSSQLHHSAPHIYAKALESFMPLLPGMSFLNVGSGTGYFNSIVGELIGDMATNHGIEILPEVVEHARGRCQRRRDTNIEFTLGNVYQLDVNQRTRYDRIYFGACANPRSKYLYTLLKVGGVLIGPFQSGHDQQLRRITRQSESQFNVEVLGSVLFSELREPVPMPLAQEITMGAAWPLADDDVPTSKAKVMTGLLGVPFTFELCEKPWSPQRLWTFPTSYKQFASVSLICQLRSLRPRGFTAACLPIEIWIDHILPCCKRWWCEKPKPAARVLGPFSPPLRIFVERPLSTPFSALPESALQPLSPLPRPVHCQHSGDEGNSDDDLNDDISTHAPSSGPSTALSTPETGPSSPPSGRVDGEAPSVARNDTLALEAHAPFEIFHDGHRHIIGAPYDRDSLVLMRLNQAWRHWMEQGGRDEDNQELFQEEVPQRDEEDEDEESYNSEQQENDHELLEELAMEADYQPMESPDLQMDSNAHAEGSVLTALI